jgi:DNA-binding XRE family transcriptional regulator
VEELIKVIKQRRESLHVTQEMLSELSEVSLRTIKKIESGKGNPTLNTMQKIGDVIGLELCFELKKIPAIDEEGADTI